jgi:hypothetical protein
MAADTDTDDDTIDTGGDDTGADNGTDSASGTDWKPPSKDEWDRQQRALTKANAEAKTRREALQALQRKTEDETGKAAREQAEAAEKRYKPVAVRSAAKAAFLEAGLQGGTPERIAKLVRMLDLDAIDVDADGDVTGLDAQVAAVKAEIPELFTVQDKKPPKVTVGDKAGTTGKPKRSSDLLAARVLGG